MKKMIAAYWIKVISVYWIVVWLLSMAFCAEFFPPYEFVANWTEYEPIGRLLFMVVHFSLIMIFSAIFDESFE